MHAPIFIIVLAYFIIFTFMSELLPDVFVFSPFLAFFLFRMKKREIFMIYVLQVSEYTLWYVRRREFVLSFVHIFVPRIREGIYFDGVLLLEFALSPLVIQGLSACFIRAIKIRKRVGMH